MYQAVQSGQYDEPVRCDLRKVDAKDARLGSIIMAEEGYDSIEAARAVRDSGGVAVEVSHGDIEDAYHQFLHLERTLAKDENLMPEPASVISIAAIKKLRKQVNLRREDKLVCLVTGSGFKARNKIREIMADDNKSLAMVDEIIARKRALQYPDASRRGRQLRVAPDEGAVREAFLKLKM
ncbi:MAG: hypothetical protein U5L96_09175 [Owenweeksia sp.]|nr:hypothetical protein [Owenweeksia sp.]